MLNKVIEIKSLLIINNRTIFFYFCALEKVKWQTNTADIAPNNCANINPIRLLGFIPVKVFVKARPIVIAGFAKLVEDVHQYPAKTVKATAAGTDFGAYLTAPNIAKIKAKVAIHSDNNKW